MFLPVLHQFLGKFIFILIFSRLSCALIMLSFLDSFSFLSHIHLYHCYFYLFSDTTDSSPFFLSSVFPFLFSAQSLWSSLPYSTLLFSILFSSYLLLHSPLIFSLISFLLSLISFLLSLISTLPFSAILMYSSLLSPSLLFSCTHLYCSLTIYVILLSPLRYTPFSPSLFHRNNMNNNITNITNISVYLAHQRLWRSLEESPTWAVQILSYRDARTPVQLQTGGKLNSTQLSSLYLRFFFSIFFSLCSFQLSFDWQSFIGGKILSFFLLFLFLLSFFLFFSFFLPSVYILFIHSLYFEKSYFSFFFSLFPSLS